MRGAFAADAPVEIPVEEFQGRCVPRCYGARSDFWD